MSEVLTGFLTDNCKLVKLADHTAAGTDPVTSAELCLAGFDGLVVLASFGTANAGNLITLHQGATPGSEAESVATVASGASDEDMVLDVQSNPAYPYVTVVATRGVETTLESVWAVLYGAKRKPPVSALAGTAAVATFREPALA